MGLEARMQEKQGKTAGKLLCVDGWMAEHGDWGMAKRQMSLICTKRYVFKRLGTSKKSRFFFYCKKIDHINNLSTTVT